MGRIKQFKHQLGRVFDTNLETKQWGNYVDYTIVGLIVLSTLSVFISTFDISESWERVLHVIDVVTVIIFTIEVSLRIWTADELSPKYHGFWGRVRYCLTFYGMIDILSTYTFYLALFLPLPYQVLKSLRVVRVLRIFRYMRSFRLLQQAITSKSKEILISLQFLLVVTLMLSFVLFFYEHEAQPETFNNGMTSVMWAFAQYIGDPGQFAETPPVTPVGQAVAFAVGILGIALFAIPAGLVGAGFSETLEEEVHKETIKKNTEKMFSAFERKLDRPTGFQIVPQHLSICDLQARIGLKVGDILDVVDEADNFRLINLATTQTIDERPQDKLAVEHFIVNKPYGYYINRGSKVTIISPSSLADAAIGNFSYYLALIGGFNYISRELGEMRPYKSYYSFDNRQVEPNLTQYMEDLEELSSRPGSWTLTPLVASGANEPSYPTIFHFSAGGAKGDESFTGDNLIVQDMDGYQAFYQDLTAELERRFEMTSDHQRYHNLTSPRLFARHFSEGLGSRNNIVLRIAWSACLWDSRRIAIAKTIADALNRHFESDIDKEYSPELKIKRSGY
ncbi:ion transporter [Porphyromonas uenonis]|uniref:ion transporter n=1 Tax=Porphyromonas uenonis TaxID=281920 RepID=UPI0026F14A6E|nr:ion transporter [Porphyromonas uenonis]